MYNMGCCRFEGVQLVVISNTLWVGEQVPCLTYGMRGMISLSLEVRQLHNLPRVSELKPELNLGLKSGLNPGLNP